MTFCVSLSNPTLLAVAIAQRRGAAYIELRPDLYSAQGQDLLLIISLVLQEVEEKFPELKVILTFRHVVHFLDLYSLLDHPNIAYVDFDLNLYEQLKGNEESRATQIFREYNLQRIIKRKLLVSYHNYEQTPMELETIENRLEAIASPVIIKLATHANSIVDSLRMLCWLQKRIKKGRPTIGLCMGELGIVTRQIALASGSPWTYAALDDSDKTAPGQLTINQFQQIPFLYATEWYGLLCKNAATSFSPAMHHNYFSHHNISGIYLRLSCQSKEEFLEALKLIDELPFYGLSVTTPWKEIAAQWAQYHTDFVELVGNANTLVRIGPEKKWLAENTDAPAVCNLVEQYMPLLEATVLILGTGSVAASIATESYLRGAKVLIRGRDQKSAEAVADLSSGRVLKDEEINRHTMANVDIIINATPADIFSGTERFSSVCPMHPSWFSVDLLEPFHIVLVVVANPEGVSFSEAIRSLHMPALEGKLPIETQFLYEARRKGCITITGIEMLLEQGLHQQQIWLAAKDSSLLSSVV